MGAVTLTKNTDIEKYKHSGYGIGYDRRSGFSFPCGGFDQNVINFGADMSSSIHIDNKKKDILVLGRGPPQGLESTLTAEKMYSINFTVTKRKFCLSLHYNGANSYLFVNGTEIIKFKANDSAIVANPLCLGNISKDWSTDNMKKTGLTGYVYHFSADYSTVTVDDIKNIHKYLILFKKFFFLGLTVISNITGAFKCILIKNQQCKVRPKIVDVSSNNPIFYPFSVKVNRCSGNCNNINNPYARICVPDIVKNFNVKVFNLMSLTNETRSIKWHETCNCICSLNICNNKQRWNKDKCICECKELIDEEVCDKGFIWNPSNCKCECAKACNTSQSLDYSDCKCKKKIN